MHNDPDSSEYSDDMNLGHMENGCARQMSPEESAARTCDEFDAVSKEPGITTVIDLDLDTKFVTRTLGVACDMKHDTFFFKTVPVQKSLTKRSILSTVSSVFDPLGFVAPYVIRAKVILQDLWVKGVDWDEPLEHDDVTDWSSWVRDLDRMSAVVIPRCYWPIQFVPVLYALHTFVDASEKAFAAVCYLLLTSSCGERHNSLVVAKTRVAPMNDKCLTLPRLELQAAVLGTRLQNTVMRELKFELSISPTCCHFWSDSLIVLQYIRNDTKRFKTFVANRLSEIRESSNPEQWHYVPSALNPADDATRGLSVGDLTQDHRWFRGPEFLWGSEDMWPSQELLNGQSFEGDVEVRHVNIASGCDSSGCDSFGSGSGCDSSGFICPADYSDLRHLLRVGAWCLRFLSNTRVSLITERETGPLRVHEINDVMMYFVRDAQAFAYSEEI
ncbi:MAG: hypothetical protein MJA29_01505, partial [Candidatus Omnitrophica bacterium]|nr:hypothetical protein [Candidatus Omnitrophota bacterium]